MQTLFFQLEILLEWKFICVGKCHKSEILCYHCWFWQANPQSINGHSSWLRLQVAWMWLTVWIHDDTNVGSPSALDISSPVKYWKLPPSLTRLLLISSMSQLPLLALASDSTVTDSFAPGHLPHLLRQTSLSPLLFDDKNWLQAPSKLS